MKETAHQASASQSSRRQDRRETPGLTAAQEVRNSLSPRLHHPVLQHRHRHQFHHRLQHRHSVAKRTLRPSGALGIRDLHGRQFRHDDGGHHACRPQGTQVPAHARHQRHHSFAFGPSESYSFAPKSWAWIASAAIQTMVDANQEMTLRFDPEASKQTPRIPSLYRKRNQQQSRIAHHHLFLWSFYRFKSRLRPALTTRALPPIHIDRATCVPDNRCQEGFLQGNPFADLNAARTAPLKIQKALIGSVPDSGARLARSYWPLCIHCLLRLWPWRLRVARSL